MYRSRSQFHLSLADCSLQNLKTAQKMISKHATRRKQIGMNSNMKSIFIKTFKNNMIDTQVFFMFLIILFFMFFIPLSAPNADLQNGGWR